MRVILSFQTEALLPPQVQDAFDADVKSEKNRVELETERRVDRQLLNLILAALFERALAGDHTARMEVQP